MFLRLKFRARLDVGFGGEVPLGPLFLNAVLEGRRGVSKQPIQSAVDFVHGPIASRTSSI